MKIKKAYKYRLYPNKKQEQTLNQMCGNVRWVWNHFRYINLESIINTGKYLTTDDMRKMLGELKDDEGSKFLSISPNASLDEVIRTYLGKALRKWGGKEPQKRLDWFKENLKITDNDELKKVIKKSKDFPNYKDKSNNTFWFQYYYKNDINNTKKIRIPNLGSVKVELHRLLPDNARVKSCTVSKDAGKWFVSILVEENVVVPTNVNPSIGIDFGCRKDNNSRKAVIQSDGTVYIMSSIKIDSINKRIIRLQRTMARQTKGSKNWNKSVEKLSKLYQKVRFISQDFRHKTTHKITQNHSQIYIEDLNVVNMTASTKGTISSPGKNVKQKSGLNKSILSVGWYEIKRQLKYKSEWNGGGVIEVPPQYTSQTCSGCGNINAEDRDGENFTCSKCGLTTDADINAAINIKNRGLTSKNTVGLTGIEACGDATLVARRSRKCKTLTVKG